MSATIDLLTLDEVRRGGKAFLQPDNESIPLMPSATWRMIETNPDHPADMPVAATLTLDGDRVATVALANQAIEFRNASYPCVWGYALESHPRVRSAGMGGMFFKEVLHRLRRQGIAFASYGGSPAATGLFRALRMADAGRAPRYVLPVGGRAIARRYVPTRPIASITGGLLTAGLRTRAAVLGRHARATAKRYRLVAQGDDAVCTIGPGDARASIARTPPSIAWKLGFARAVPGADPRTYALKDRSGGQVAFLMLRFATHERIGSQGFRDARVCRVLDLVTDGTKDAATAAVAHLLRLCAKEYTDLIELITTDENIWKVCEELRFIRSNGYDLLITRNKDLPPELFDIRNWFLNMMESDPAFY